MSTNPILVVLYAELGVLFVGILIPVITRLLARAKANEQAANGEDRRGLVVSRLST
jgi:hypothetical protein